MLHNKENILPHHDALGTKVSDVPAALVDFKHKNFFVEYFNWNDDDLLLKLRSVAFVGQLFSIGYVIVVGFVNNDLDLDWMNLFCCSKKIFAFYVWTDSFQCTMPIS